MEDKGFALFSVFYKDQVEFLAKKLVDRGYTILASRGTGEYLQRQGVEVSFIENITGFSDLLEGRVKTLHPNVFAPILARNNEKDLKELSLLGMKRIDFVVVNLYPFSSNRSVEMIDIGGVALIRAAAKNFDRVTVVVDKEDYQKVGNLLDKVDKIPLEVRKNLAYKAFVHTSRYDAYIAHWLRSDGIKDLHLIPLEKVYDLRYGENPSQRAALYRCLLNDRKVLGGFEQLQGKKLSYNNILDSHFAIRIVRDLLCYRNAVAIVKHGNPCGVGIGSSVKEAFEYALAGDPLSAFGSVVASTRTIDLEAAKSMKKLFIEVLIAPEFTKEALAILSEKKNLRIVKTDIEYSDPIEFRSVIGGVVVQDQDRIGDEIITASVVTTRKPSPDEMRALDFAWRVVKNVKSNAIVIANHYQTIGIGAGQMSRVDSCKIAVRKAKENRLKIEGTVAASDAFFPFSDGVEILAKAGVSAIAQPGGSKRDAEVIAKANEMGISMVFTGIRHFLH